MCLHETRLAVHFLRLAQYSLPIRRENSFKAQKPLALNYKTQISLPRPIAYLITIFSEQRGRTFGEELSIWSESKTERLMLSIIGHIRHCKYANVISLYLCRVGIIGEVNGSIWIPRGPKLS